MRILFLDIDGVLNSTQTCERFHATSGENGYGWPPELEVPSTKEALKWGEDLVARLRRIVEVTRCHIVISSSWRGYGEHAVKKWQEMFRCYGWENAPVIGETHKSRSGFRGLEVEVWVDQNQPLVDRIVYVILDDGSDFHAHQPLVQTNPDVGLQADDAERAIQILEGQPDPKCAECGCLYYHKMGCSRSERSREQSNG